MVDTQSLQLDELYRPTKSPLTQESKTVNIIPIESVSYASLSTAARGATAVVGLSKEQGIFTDLQLAINFVNSKGGGSVLIKEGTYVLSNDITLYSNIELRGESRTGTILDFNESAKSLEIGSLSNVTINNLTIANTTNYGITVSSSSRIIIANCDFDDNDLDIYMASSSTSRVEGCSSADSGSFLSLSANGNSCQFSNLNIASTTSHAIIGATFSGGTFINITVTDPVGATVYGSFARATFKAINTVYNSDTNSSYYVIELTDGTQNTFSEFYAQGSGEGAIQFASGGSFSGGSNRLVNSFFWNYHGTGGTATSGKYAVKSLPDKTVIAHNVFLGVGTGILFVGDSNVISGNVISALAGTGVGLKVDSSSAGNAIIGNNITTDNYGVWLNGAGADYNTVIGNVINHSGTGVYDNGNNNEVAHNVAY